MRNSKTPDDSVELTSSRVGLSTRLASARASRGEKRIFLDAATTTSTIETIPPTTVTAKPRVVHHSTTTTTAKPKPKAKPASSPPAKPKPSSSTAPSPSPASYPPEPKPGPNTSHQSGQASWYDASYHAQNPWICAHRTLPMGTIITVTDTDNGKSITCEVGDRGPYGGTNRVLDLSKYAFSQLANPSSGVVNVQLSW